MDMITIWQLLDIYNLEKAISERLAIKTAALAQQMKSKKYDFIFLPWDKKFKKDKDIEELNALREFLVTLKEAKKEGMRHCEFYQCEADGLVDESITKFGKRFQDFEEKSESSKNSALLLSFLDLYKSFYKPNENEALSRAVKEMKRLNELVSE